MEVVQIGKGHFRKIFIQPNPFSSAQELLVHPNLTISEMIIEAKIPEHCALVWIGGNLFPQELWKTTKLKENSHMVIGCRAGKGTFGLILKIVIMAVATYFTAGLAGYYFAASGAIAGFGAALSVAGSLVVGIVNAVIWTLLNLLIPPPKPKGGPGTAAEVNSQTWNVTAQGNDPKHYQPVIKVYGRHKLYPPMAAAPFAVWHGLRNDMYLLYDLGYGSYELEGVDNAAETPKPKGNIGETPISDFSKDDIYWKHVSYISPTETPAEKLFKYYISDVEGEAYSLKLTNNVLHTRVSASYASRIQIDINFGGGLYSINDQNSTGFAWVEFEVMMGEILDDTSPDGVSTFLGDTPVLNTQIINIGDTSKLYAGQGIIGPGVPVGTTIIKTPNSSVPTVAGVIEISKPLTQTSVRGSFTTEIIYQDLTNWAFNTYAQGSADIIIPAKIFANNHKLTWTYQTYTVQDPAPVRDTYSRYGNNSYQYWEKDKKPQTVSYPLDLVGNYYISAGSTTLQIAGKMSVGIKFVIPYQSGTDRHMAGHGGYGTHGEDLVRWTYTPIYTDQQYTVTSVVGTTITITPPIQADIFIGSQTFYSVNERNANTLTGSDMATYKASFENYLRDNYDKFYYITNAKVNKSSFKVTGATDASGGLNFTFYFEDLKSSKSTATNTVYGKYSVRLRRLREGAQFGTVVRNDCYWVGMRTFRSIIPVVAPRVPHQFIEMFVQASERLNQPISNYNLVLTSVLPICMNVADWEDMSKWTPKPTRNPAWIFVDILTGWGNAKPVPLTELDGPSIMNWAQYCDHKLPQYEGVRYTCDFVLDFQTTIRDLLDKVCSTGRAAVAIINGKYGVLLDEQKDTPVQIFTPRNYSNFSSTRNYLPQPHGLRVKWVDPLREWEVHEELVANDGYTLAEAVDWQPNTPYKVKEIATRYFPPVPPSVITTSQNYKAILSHTSSNDFNADFTAGYWMKVETATKLETFDTFGTTRVDQAVRFARYYMAQMKLRQENITIDVDIENLVSNRGDRVQLVAEAMRVGGRVARITAIAGAEFTVDERIELISGTTYNFEIRSPSGIQAGNSVTLVDATGYKFILGGVTKGDLAAAQIEDLLIIGQAGYVTYDCIIKEIRPNKNYGASLTLQEYAPEIFNAADGGEIDIYDARITPDILKKSPTPPLNVLALETITYDIQVAYSNIKITYTLPKNEVYGSMNLWVDTGDIDVGGNAPGYQLSQSQAPEKPIYFIITAGKHFVNKVGGKLLRFKLQGVSIDGFKEPIENLVEHTITLTGDIENPPTPQRLDLNVTNDSTLITWIMPLTPDVWGFQLRFSPQLDAISWNQTSSFVDYIPFDQSSVRVPTRVGTYMLKSRDSSGNFCVNPAIGVTSLPILSNMNLLETIIPETGGGEWNVGEGIYLNTATLDYTPPVEIPFNIPGINLKEPRFKNLRNSLKARSTELYKTSGQALILRLATASPITYVPDGIFEFSRRIILDDIYTIRISNLLKSHGRHVSPILSSTYWDPLADVGPINAVKDDQWDAYMEVKIGESDAPLVPGYLPNGDPDYTVDDTWKAIWVEPWAIHSLTDATADWTEWRKVYSGDYTGKYFAFRFKLTTKNNQTTPVLTSGTIRVDIPDRNIYGNNLQTDDTGHLRIDFNPPFMPLYGASPIKDRVTVAIGTDNAQQGDTYTVYNKTRVGFDIQFYENGAIPTNRVFQFDFNAKGYGRLADNVI